MTTPLRSFFVSVLVVAGLLVSFSAQAATVQWFPNPETDIAGYKLSYGTQSGVYTTSIDVGKVTTWQLTLAPGQRYFIVVQAYNTAGGTSPYSAEAVYDAPPAPTLNLTLTSLLPSSGPVATAVTIGGTGFGATKGASTVTFNGTTAAPTTWSATSIVVPVPAGATSGNVIVIVGGIASNTVFFNVDAVPPTLTSLSPANGPVATAVTIGGSNFGASQGTSTVTFNGIAASPTSWSATSITVPVPAGATSGNVVVTVGGRSSPSVPFLINPASPQGVKLKPQP